MNNSTSNPAICNKCGLEVKVEETQKSIYLLNAMHTFNTDFLHCGKDTNLDMQSCKFTLCQSCLLQFFNTFKVKVEYEDTKEWNSDTYNDEKLSNVSDEEIKIWNEYNNQLMNFKIKINKNGGCVLGKFNKDMFIELMLEFLIGYAMFGIFVFFMHLLFSSTFTYSFGSFEIFYATLALSVSALRSRN